MVWIQQGQKRYIMDQERAQGLADTFATQFSPNHHHVTTAFNRNQTVVMVSLDLKKAFDKTHHEGLLLKMKDCGLPARMKTVRTYLQNRRFHIVMNGTGSSAKGMTSGIPQGFATGPVLFRIYVRDIPKMRGSPGKTSKTQEDTQKPPAISVKEDTRGICIEEGSPAKQRRRWHNWRF
ncbi:hypothetical protein Trydic_g19867 [Trypoxylus dichotomus]